MSNKTPIAIRVRTHSGDSTFIGANGKEAEGAATRLFNESLKNGENITTYTPAQGVKVHTGIGDGTIWQEMRESGKTKVTVKGTKTDLPS